MGINDNIISALDKIEKDNKVTILLAVESGSRSWGFPSNDSDYDCRFIYVNNREFYLSIDEGKDFIEQPFDKVYDINGWDIKKVLKAIRRNNPIIFEWLQSPIVYKEIDGFKKEAMDLCQKYFDIVPVLYHYLNTAKNKYVILEARDAGKLKTYFYLIRSILACKWSINNPGVPPMEISILLEGCNMSKDVSDEIDKLLKIKESEDESFKISKNNIILDFCNNIIIEVSDYLSQNSKRYDNDSKELNEFFRKVLK